MNWNIFVDFLSVGGTIASAIAAFWATQAAASSATATQNTLNYQMQLENLAKVPKLLIVNAFWDDKEGQNGFRLQFANLGGFPIVIRWFIHEVHKVRTDNSQSFDLLIPAGEAKEKLIEVNFPMEDGCVGEFRFFFLYGPTGLVYHRIAIPYTIITEPTVVPDQAFSQEERIYSAEQKIDMNLGTEKEILEKNVLSETRFSGFSGMSDIYLLEPGRHL